MAAEHQDWNRQSEYSDSSPLLMANPTSSDHQHVITILPISNSAVPSPEGSESDGHCSLSSRSAPQPERVLSGGIPSRSLSPSSSLQARASFTSNVASSLSRPGNANSYGTQHRANPLISGIWITFEVVIIVSQIIASIIVLILSRDEKPEAPLSAWVAGYAAGCLASLPLLYWRYKYRIGRAREQDALAPPFTSPSAVPTDVAGQSSYLSTTPEHRDEESQVERQSDLNGVANGFDRLCIVFLTFSCIGYAMPFILCATICCCLPCIITFLGYQEESRQVKGASVEAIAALPTYRFKLKGANDTKINKEENESDSEGLGEGGLVAAGTDKERLVSPEDAVCCICLGKYKDNVELRELPCTHHFHVECVDKWLAINASCPLCKHDVGGSTEADAATPEETGSVSIDRVETPQAGASPS